MSRSTAVAVEFRDLANSAHVTFLAAELCAEERIDDLGGGDNTDDPPPKCENVHVVMFDRLMCRVVVVDHSGADTDNLVRRDGTSGARAAHDDSPFAIPIHDAPSDRRGIVRIVDRVARVCAYIDYDVARVLKMADKLLLELEPGVI